jgi:iron complex outermembrane recepter protein
VKSWTRSTRSLRSAGRGALASLLAISTGSAGADTGATPATDEGIEEVIVTAQKRAESAQDVGLSMQAVSGEELALRGATAATDLITAVPNVQANYGAGLVSFNVRGIGTNEFAANIDSPVAINVDEIYVSKTYMTSLLMFDLERTEVLYGPQGTLYGRNATGGAVNFLTRRPTAQTSGGVSLSYDDYETVRFEGFVSGTLSGGLTGRLSAMIVDQGRGTYRNSTLDRREGLERKQALRGQLQWAGGETTALLTLFAGQQSGELIPYEGVGVFTPGSLAAGSPVLCPEYLAGAANGASSNCRRLDGGYPGDADPFTSTNNRPHSVDNESYSASLRVEHEFGSATLTSITAYQQFTRQQHEDVEGTPIDFFDVDYYNRVRQVSQELRLSSSGDQRLSYVGGLYYGNDKYSQADYFNVAGGAVAGLLSRFKQDSKAFAAFVHGDYKVSDALSIVAGLRYSRERIGFDGATYLASGLAGDPPQPTTLILPLAADTRSNTDTDVTWKAGVEWRPEVSGNTFDKVMVFANVSTGFRSGSFNAEFVSALSALTTLSPEEITAYEAGIKSSLADRTMQLNASVFHYSFRNGFINVDRPGSPIPATANAAAIRSTGAEVSWLWQPKDEVKVGMATGWLRSRIDSDITSAGISLKDKDTVQSPKLTYMAQANWSPQISPTKKLILAADASYRASQYYESNNSPMSLEDGYWLANLRVGIGGSDGQWSVAAFVKNLSDTKYRTYVNDVAANGFVLNIYGPPRTYGVAASYKF